MGLAPHSVSFAWQRACDRPFVSTRYTSVADATSAELRLRSSRRACRGSHRPFQRGSTKALRFRGLALGPAVASQPGMGKYRFVERGQLVDCGPAVYLAAFLFTVGCGSSLVGGTGGNGGATGKGGGAAASSGAAGGGIGGGGDSGAAGGGGTGGGITSGAAGGGGIGGGIDSGAAGG